VSGAPDISGLFDKRGNIGAALESLAGRNARSALGMFADIIASPHVPTNQIGSTAAAAPVAKIEEDRIVLNAARFYLSRIENWGAIVIIVRSPGLADRTCLLIRQEIDFLLLQAIFLPTSSPE